MPNYLGDIIEDATISFAWNTFDAAGASITRATNGTIFVRRQDDGTDATGTAVTDTEDTPDTGLHECVIDTSDNANFTPANDYVVWLDGAVIDGQTVNAVLATFSIANRSVGVPVALDAGPATIAGMLTKMADDNGGSNFDAGTDSQEAISNSAAAQGGVLYNPVASSTINTGTPDANTFASTISDDGVKWTIGDSNGDGGAGGSATSDFTIDVICEFNMGASRIASQLILNGYYNRSGGGQNKVEVWAYNYTSNDWDILSTGTVDTDLRDRANDRDYIWPLSSSHTDHVTVPGEVKINFRSTRATTQNGDVLYLDHVEITGLSSSALSPEAIALATHAELDVHFTHIQNHTGEIHYVSTAAGDDGNSGHYPDSAFATIGAALAVAVAGEIIIIGAGTYDEAITLTLAGLELRAEHGAILNTSAAASSVTITAEHCCLTGFDVRPLAGQIGYELASGSSHTHLDNCESTSGTIGIQIASDVNNIELTQIHKGILESILTTRG